MILGLQIIAVIFILVMIYFSYLHYRRGELNGLEYLILFLVWCSAIFITLFPNIFTIFSHTIAVSRAFDLAVIGGFLFVIPLVYSSYIRTKRLQKKLEEFVRSQALSSFKLQFKKKKSRNRKTRK